MAFWNLILNISTAVKGSKREFEEAHQAEKSDQDPWHVNLLSIDRSAIKVLIHVVGSAGRSKHDF